MESHDLTKHQQQQEYNTTTRTPNNNHKYNQQHQHHHHPYHQQQHYNYRMNDSTSSYSYHQQQSNRISCINIPENSLIEVSEIDIVIDHFDYIKKVIGGQTVIRRYLSKRDESFFYVIGYGDNDNDNHGDLKVNERATLLTRPRKEVYGNCILVHCDGKQQQQQQQQKEGSKSSSSSSSSYKPLSVVQFNRLIQVITCNYPIFDFKNNTNNTTVNLISTILYPNDFIYPLPCNDEWTFKKTPQSILNELYTIKKLPPFQPCKYEFPPGQLFVCFCELDEKDGKVSFVSSKSNQLKKAQGNLAHKLLCYYLMLQNAFLHGQPLVVNSDTSYQDFKKELEEIEEAKKRRETSKKVDPLDHHFGLLQQPGMSPVISQPDGLEKTIIREGNKDIKLSNFTRLKAQVTIYLLEEPKKVKKRMFLKKIKQSDLEEPNASDRFIPALIKILPTVQSGEACVVKVPPSYGYGDVGSPSDQIPPMATLIIYIDCKSLKHFHTIEEACQLPIEKKLELVAEYRSWASTKFKLFFFEKCDHLYSQALKIYKSILTWNEYLDNLETYYDKVAQVGSTLYCNMAIVQAKMGEWQIARDYCTLSLETLPNHKAYFWKSKAHHHLGNLVYALEDINGAIKMIDQQKKLIIIDNNNNSNNENKENDDQEPSYEYDSETMDILINRRNKILESFLSTMDENVLNLELDNNFNIIVVRVWPTSRVGTTGPAREGWTIHDLEFLGDTESDGGDLVVLALDEWLATVGGGEGADDLVNVDRARAAWVDVVVLEGGSDVVGLVKLEGTREVVVDVGDWAGQGAGAVLAPFVGPEISVWASEGGPVVVHGVEEVRDFVAREAWSVTETWMISSKMFGQQEDDDLDKEGGVVVSRDYDVDDYYYSTVVLIGYLYVCDCHNAQTTTTITIKTIAAQQQQ
ncbi:hypothetical protein DFA_07192 [Cavenderia fasciculata]|uniref:peptidylprolyl isomerase n=1 Tax=Cavenderia fasciculata TaxID=261658 RepID=F4PVR1_CACFS|nr:uncharacterized protein DFA_07192 [Cavenderia fasciculata]EGG20075.1 hypothetical protein DFA_07192 [Cavenderia fasciculata]|eukprot:XP_004367058.1 hypothetical protein DFA_07192 [Cavenderia fasciculata]